MITLTPVDPAESFKLDEAYIAKALPSPKDQIKLIGFLFKNIQTAASGTSTLLDVIQQDPLLRGTTLVEKFEALDKEIVGSEAYNNDVSTLEGGDASLGMPLTFLHSDSTDRLVPCTFPHPRLSA